MTAISTARRLRGINAVPPYLSVYARQCLWSLRTAPLGLTGAAIGEGISWQKVQTDANYETVIGDAIVVFSPW